MIWARVRTSPSSSIIAGSSASLVIAGPMLSRKPSRAAQTPDRELQGSGLVVRGEPVVAFLEVQVPLLVQALVDPAELQVGEGVPGEAPRLLEGLPVARGLRPVALVHEQHRVHGLV